MLDQLAPNKKTMPPQPESQPRQKSTKVIRQLISPKCN